jgi:hypothetical protein
MYQAEALLKTDLSRVEMDFIGEIFRNSLAEGIARRLVLICCDSRADSLNRELDAAEAKLSIKACRRQPAAHV